MKTTDRLPPHSIEAEQGVLGCCLLASDCIGECIEKLSGNADAFYDLRHRTLYQTLCEMFSEHQPIDLITVQQRLRDRQQLEGIGGLAYLAELPDKTPSAANLGAYIPTVNEKHLLRRTLKLCADTSSAIFDTPDAAQEVVENFERDALALRQGTDNEVVDIRAEIQGLIDGYEAARQNKGPRGLLTGYGGFDSLTGGLKPGWLFILAARPSVGKTALALNIADYVAIDTRQLVGVISLEMTGKELLHRMGCSRARLDARKADEGHSTDAEYMQLAAAMGQIRKAPLRIYDRAGITMNRIRAVARRWKAEGLKLLVIDYLGLIGSAERGRSRYESITASSNELKHLAKELGVPIICLAQLNRDTEKEGRAPRMSDLRDSGAIEQDADVIALLHWPEDAVGDCHKVCVFVNKCRNGATGNFTLQFNKPQTRFESL